MGKWCQYEMMTSPGDLELLIKSDPGPGPDLVPVLPLDVDGDGDTGSAHQPTAATVRRGN